MQVRRISIFDEFECVGAACPLNCCTGWRIPVSNDLYMKYLKEKGPFGMKLRCLLKQDEDMFFFRSLFYRCPFFGNDRLCSIQKKHGTDYMPDVCVQFPRQLYHLGFFCEEMLYLACPEVVNLFLKSLDNDDPFPYTVMEEEVSYEVNTTNDDEAFLKYLTASRDELTGMLRGGMRYDSMAILDYGCDARNACLSKTTLPSPLAYASKDHYRMDLEVMNKLFFNGFYHQNLSVVSPFLHKMCKKYIREFYHYGQKDPKAAEEKLEKLQQDLHQKMPNPDKLFNRYYEYFLLTNFLDIYEDYSFTRCLIYGMAKTNMVRLFLALYASDKEYLETEEIAKIIAAYERRAPQIRDALKKL